MKHIFKKTLKIGCLTLIAWGQGSAGAQSLINNGGFEDYTTCPPSYGYAQYATGWENPYCGSADYLNACAETGWCDVPNNAVAYQLAASGQAYMGMATYGAGDPYYREVVGTDLVEPLVPGVPVYVSFMVCAGGDGNDFQNTARYASKGIGIRFVYGFPPSYQDYRETFLDKPPAVFMSEVLDDTTQWQLITGVYVPDSAYTKVMVGNFLQDSLSGVYQFTEGAWQTAYALVDDLCISTDPAYCPEAVGLREHWREPRVTISPVPFGDQVQVRSADETDAVVMVTLSDASGRSVAGSGEERSGASLRLNTTHLKAGIYILHAVLTSGRSTQRTVICTNH